VQLLPSLVLDGVGIALEPVDMLLQAIILLLEFLHLKLELTGLLPLLLVYRNPVRAEDDVISHTHRKDGSGQCRGLTAPDVDRPIERLE